MKHVQQKQIEAAVEVTLGRLKRAANGEDPFKDSMNVVSRHFTKIGQQELADVIDDFVIDYTTPATADVKAAS